MDSKSKYFKLEDIASYIKYLKRHPSAYAELYGVKLYWFQRVFLFIWIKKILIILLGLNIIKN